MANPERRAPNPLRPESFSVSAKNRRAAVATERVGAGSNRRGSRAPPVRSWATSAGAWPHRRRLRVLAIRPSTIYPTTLSSGATRTTRVSARIAERLDYRCRGRLRGRNNLRDAKAYRPFLFYARQPSFRLPHPGAIGQQPANTCQSASSNGRQEAAVRR